MPCFSSRRRPPAWWVSSRMVRPRGSGSGRDACAPWSCAECAPWSLSSPRRRRLWTRVSPCCARLCAPPCCARLCASRCGVRLHVSLRRAPRRVSLHPARPRVSSCHLRLRSAVPHAPFFLGGCFVGPFDVPRQAFHPAPGRGRRGLTPRPRRPRPGSRRKSWRPRRLRWGGGARGGCRAGAVQQREPREHQHREREHSDQSDLKGASQLGHLPQLRHLRGAS